VRERKPYKIRHLLTVKRHRCWIVIGRRVLHQRRVEIDVVNSISSSDDGIARSKRLVSETEAWSPVSLRHFHKLRSGRIQFTGARIEIGLPSVGIGGRRLVLIA